MSFRKQHIRSMQGGKLTNARRAPRGVQRSSPSTRPLTPARARTRSAIPLRAENPTHRVWLLVLAELST